jgi:hypothetical protein
MLARQPIDERMCGVGSIAYYVQGFVSGRELKKQMFNNNKKMSKEIKDQDLTVSPACTKPLVKCSTHCAAEHF